MKKQKTFRDLYKESFEFIRESKNYIYFSILIFLVFALTGFFILPNPEIKARILVILKEITLQFQGLSLWQTIWEIFANNLKASFLSIVLGVFLGIFPLMVTISNGYLIGFVANMVVEKEGVLILWKLFPHGIFELPAVFISIGLGIRIGLSVFKEKNETWKYIKKSLLTFLIVVMVLLVIAAVIEGTLMFLLP